METLARISFKVLMLACLAWAASVADHWGERMMSHGYVDIPASLQVHEADSVTAG